jgi:dipeptidyl aminopeptidase/acylaminoacyl peptidase
MPNRTAFPLPLATLLVTLLITACGRADVAPPAPGPVATAPAAPADATRDTVPATYLPSDIPAPEPAELDLAGAACQSIARFLNIQSVAGAHLSPDGRTMIYRTSVTGLPQLWRVQPEAAGAEGYPEQLTFGNRVQFADYSPRGDWIAYGTDRAGDERTQFFLLSPDGRQERELTPADGAFRNWGGWSPRGNRIAYSSTERDGRNFDIWIRDIDPAGRPVGEPRMVMEGAGNLNIAAWRPDGEAVVLSQGRGEADNDLFLLDFATGALDTLFVPTEMSSYTSIQWTPDGSAFFLATNHYRDLAGLARYDLASRSLTWIYESPDWDVESVALSRDGRYLAWTVNEEGWSRLELRDLRELEADRGARFVPIRVGGREATELPRGVVTGLSWARDVNRLAISVSGPDIPGDAWVYDPRVGGGQGTYRRVTRSSTAGLDPGDWVEPEHVYFPSFDGLMVFGLLYLPRATGDGPAPVVVTLHGGPTAQGRPNFNAITQYLLSRGYAVFDFNYRGSTGYGQQFTQADNMRRRTDQIRDLEAAARYLKDRPEVDGTRLAAMGGSYGGFMTLAALAWYPELYAAGVNFVGVANWITALEDASPALKNSDLIEYGDIDDPDDRAFFRSISPIEFADNITSDLMVIHGANDPRVPVAEADQIVAAVRERGGEVTYLRFPDEGHGIARLENRITTYQGVARFLDRSIGGPGMPCWGH